MQDLYHQQWYTLGIQKGPQAQNPLPILRASAHVFLTMPGLAQRNLARISGPIGIAKTPDAAFERYALDPKP